MVKKGQVELLSPAGNIEGFYGAVHAGADAVYLGGRRFGARAYAENFTEEELTECIRYGHLFGRKIYLTVNTLLKENELSELFDYLSPFSEAGLDGVIVQDIGVLRFIRKNFPGLELHASTQMTLCSHHGAEFLKELGAVRIVPARELSLQEISEMKSRVDMELETFIHGAMCYCYSGQCLFSSMLGGRSGNRGCCAQPCRLPYQVRSGRNRSGTCYPLSLKDMCTVEHIPQFIEAGIDSFKIEGRMKKPEYTAGVTAVYRKYIDLYYGLREQYGALRAAERYQILPEDMEALSSLYIRSEKQNGYYFKHNGGDMVALSHPAYNKNDEMLLDQIRNRYLDRRLKLPVTVYGSFPAGEPAKVILRTGTLSVTVQGPSAEKAQKQPVTEENIRRQLGKMGESAFTPTQMELHVGEDVFYPLKQVNELRREAVAELERSLLEENGYGGQTGHRSRQPADSGESGFSGTCRADRKQNEESVSSDTCRADREQNWVETTGIVLSVRTPGQLQGVADYQARHPEESLKRLYVDSGLLLKQMRETTAFCEKLCAETGIYISLPYILRQKDDKYLESLADLMCRYPMFSGMLVRSLDGLAYVEKAGFRNRLDTNVYCWNSMAMEELASLSEGGCLPLELTAGEQRKLLENCRRLSGGWRFEKLVYGRIPMMVTANCLLKTTEGCQPENENRTVLVDRYHKEFPVVRICENCMNILYNSVPLSLHQDLEKWRKRTDIRLDFTIESYGETVGILEAFFHGAALPYGEYTTGHEKRGVGEPSRNCQENADESSLPESS